MSPGLLQSGPTTAPVLCWEPQRRRLLVMAVLCLVRVMKAPAVEVSYCLPHPERPCWGVRLSLSERIGTDNPFDGLVVPLDTFIQAVDWNRDGHMDLLLTGNRRVGLLQGHANGSFSELLGTANPFAWINVTGSIGEAVDWDEDGHMDLLLLSDESTLRFFRGDADGSLSEQTEASNPFAGLTMHGVPHVVDWDRDGHKDLLVGDLVGVRVFRGSAEGSLSEPRRVVDVTGSALPIVLVSAVDWDGDGRTDLIASDFQGAAHFFLRSYDGSLSEQKGTANPFAGLAPDKLKGILPVDWDRDGHMDVLLVDGSVRFVQGYSDDGLREQTGAANPFTPISALVGYSAPEVVDWDGDGNTDLLLGSRDGTVRFFRGGNDGSVSEQAGAANPFDGIKVGLDSRPQAVDWDGDGRLDLLVGSYWGIDLFLGGVDGRLVWQNGTAFPFFSVYAEHRGFSPHAVDWDGDGLLDLLVGTGIGTVLFFRGNATGSLLEQEGVANPFLDIDVGFSASPRAVDWDGDGLLELLLGAGDGRVHLFLRGTNGGVSRQRDVASPFAGINVGSCYSPVVVDWDGDGHRDLLVGHADGGVRFFSAQCDSTVLGQRKVCSSAGTCEPFFGRCRCAASNEQPEAPDCSLCASFFYKERSNPICQACPGFGTSKGPCLRRGTCLDARTAREALREGMWTPWQGEAPGDGTCVCEAPFFGRDCGEGECPAGSELVVETRANSSVLYPFWEACTACAAGQFKAAPGNVPCDLCAAGTYQSSSGASACDLCPGGTKQSASGSSSCDTCAGGSAPNALRTACEACSPGLRASPGQERCVPCDAGRVPADDRSGCKPCGRGQFVAQGERECHNCPVFHTSEAGSTRCRLHQTVVPSILLLLCILAVGCILRLLRHRRRHAILVAMQGGNALKLREALERGSRVGLGRADVQPAQRRLQVLERKYVDYEYLLKIVGEGDLKLVKGTWLADVRNGQRLKRRQDLPEEAFWTEGELRCEVRAVLFVAVSYCWLQEVHPDPLGVHLRTLRHVIRLRLGFRGPGQVIDIALFLDYCSLAQHGERGDPASPERGELRTPEQQASFTRGLRQVNIPYANQAVEVWMMQWVPDNEDRKYMTRGWPYFEQAVASLIKDPAQLLLILPESLHCRNWLELHNIALGGRRPPLTPAQFNQQIACKTFTSPGTDRALVIKKYEETFHDVMGYAETLWFSSLGWHDEDAVQLAEVLPHCKSLEQLFLGSNCITTEGALALVKAAKACPVRGMDLSDNLIAEHDEEGILRLWQSSNKGPGDLRMGKVLAKAASPILLSL